MATHYRESGRRREREISLHTASKHRLSEEFREFFSEKS